MHYRINVAKDGKHFFATASHSLTTTDEAQSVYKEISERFPEEEGFEVTVVLVEAFGKPVDWAPSGMTA